MTRTISNKQPTLQKLAKHLCLAVVMTTLAACSGGTSESTDEFQPTGDFEIRSSAPGLVLIEGDQNGLQIPLSLTRSNGHSDAVTLDIKGVSEADVAFVTSSFSRLQLTPSEDESEAILKLAISDQPIQAQQRQFVITATDGIDEDRMAISVIVQPTSAPDVYLLIGQSNMVGFSGDGTRESYLGGADEPNPRIKQFNGTSNNDDNTFVTDSDYTSELVNVGDPSIVEALDPLHIPLDPYSENGKAQDYIGLGLSFAKTALNDTTADVVLVPAAWAGSSFCNNTSGPDGNWMPWSTQNSDLGNTLLFDRAVTRSNLAVRESGGVLRGILWHQGESDANERCAPLYADNLKNLAEQLRNDLETVGNDSLNRISDTSIPFVVGTMSRGEDERDNLSNFPTSKQMIDDAHFNFPNTVENGGVSDHSDLTPANGYPCGNTSCIHFGPEALREMGSRYYYALRNALL